LKIYKKKSRWKFWLALFAASIVVASLWYTSIISTRIANDEKKQVNIWARAIRERAELVESARVMFEKLADEERKKVELWANALKRAISNTGEDIDPIIVEIISSNKNIPVILIDNSNKIVGFNNLETDDLIEGDTLPQAYIDSFTSYDPIVIDLYGNLSYVYYKDSKLLTEIKEQIRKIISSFITSVLQNSASVPVIYTDSVGNLIGYGNLDTSRIEQAGYIENNIDEMKSENDPIEILFGQGHRHYIYYKDSYLLKQIEVYPYIQLGIIGLFLIVAYYAFSSARKSEQNQVWVGMSKETAHQLGTPISSLVGWVEYFRSEGVDEKILTELQKDVDRLKLITERFSKVGSKPKLEKVNICEHLHQSLDYLGKRVSSQVKINFNCKIDVYANISSTLFDWVIENLVKNAVDAMVGKGRIDVAIQVKDTKIIIDFTDSGKGIPKSEQKTIFNPGFSTKRRGWGLGLSLSKRIINNYHSGNIFVKHSEINKGTTFRIVLPKV
jgi:two-component sensor histidine kinase